MTTILKGLWELPFLSSCVPQLQYNHLPFHHYTLHLKIYTCKSSNKTIQASIAISLHYLYCIMKWGENMYIMSTANWFKLLKWREIYYADQTNSAFTLTYGSTECWVELIVTESMYEAALANPWVSHKHDLKQPLSGGWSHFLISLLM